MILNFNHRRKLNFLLKGGFLCLIMILCLVSNAQLTENFSSGSFPPSGWTVYNDPNYVPPNMTKRSATVNGYGSTAGMGAVYVDFWNAPVGIKDSLKSPTLNPTIAGDSLIFDHVHATASGQVVHDSMAIYTSTTNGVSWNRLEGLLGNPTNLGCQTCLSTFTGALLYELLAPTGSSWMTKKYALPIGTNRIVFVFYSNYGENMFLDNVIVTRNIPMVYSDAVAAQAPTDTVFDGMNNAAIINAQVLAVNSGSPLPVTSITANTAGSTSVADIRTAKLYYTGVSGGFNLATATLLGTINNPSGSMVFSGFSQTLAGAVSNFWIVYDVAPYATPGNVLDATFTSLVVNGVTRTPSIQNPAGSRYIKSHKTFKYCFWTTISTINYLSGPTNVTFGSINNQTADLNQVTNYADQSTALYQGDSAQIFVTIGPGNYETVGIYMDWNNNGTFDLPAEQVYTCGAIPGGSTIGLPLASPVSAPAYIKVPCNTSTGFHRFRVVSDLSAVNACGPINYGDGEDYSLEVKGQPNPVASYSAPDTFYTNGLVLFTNTSSGFGLSYQWDFTYPSTYTSTAKNGTFQYPINGTYLVKLRVKSTGCSGTFFDSVIKTIVIVAPPSTTVANFISDRNVVSPGDVVTFYDLSTFGPGTWSWSISPSNVGGIAAYTFTNGTTSSSPSPQVMFNAYGKFTVTLTATNTLGSSTKTKANYINVVHSINMCAGGNNVTTTDDAGFLYDDGGKFANYTKGKDCFLLIKPGCAAQIQLKFNMFDISTIQWSGYPPGADWIKVWDGINTTGIPLHAGINWPAGIQNKIFNTPWLPPTLIANSGAMYIEYWTTGVGGQKGFEIEWTSTPIVGNTPPAASFNVPDTIYTGVAGTYIATATGVGNSYDWDFNNDGVFDASGSTVSYMYTSPVSTTVKLVISSCLGSTTLTKVVKVLDPSVPPTPLFTVNFTSGTPVDEFQLVDGSKNGPTSWKWTITPATYTFVSGTTTSQNITVKFTAVGVYTVKLRVANAFGADSLTKTNYLKVFYYCTPNVNMMTPDIGISNVTFGNINNTTDQGIIGYNDYTTIGTTTFELGGVYPITIKRTTNVNAINRKVWMDLNGDGDFIDANETLFQDAGSTSLSVTGTLTIPVNATLGNTRLRVGVNTSNLPNLGCGANFFGEYEDYRINIIPDITKPVITLTGGDTIYIEVGRVFNDPGASATDNVTNPQTFTATYNGFTNGTAIANPGTYTITYTAVDGTGNTAVTRIRTVIVTPDITKPVVTLLGPDSMVIAVGGVFTDPGATATDFFFGPISPVNVIGTVNTTIVGIYPLSYSVVDLHGNLSNIVQRKVYVIDTVKPVITVNGANPYLWDVHRKPFVDPGVTVTDNYCTSGLNAIASTINLDSLGTYTITYSFKDCNGNIAVSKTRTVIVQDTIKPTLTFTLGTDIYLIDVKTLGAVPEPGYTLSDNYYSSSQLTVSKVGTVDLNVLGSYPVAYTVTDLSANTSKVYTRIYNVVDRVKPVITLVGAAVANINRWQVYNDSGAMVTDNYYTNLVPILSGVVDVNLAGIYYLSFNVTDPSGNIADVKKRIINVKESFGGINNSAFEKGLNIYPNPNTGKFTLEVKMEDAKNMSIAIYDMMGKKVKDLANEKISTGIYNFDLSDVAAGNYMIQFTTDKETVSKKLTIIRK